MVLKIKLGKEKEKRLKKHLEKEHPSTKGKTFIENNDHELSIRNQIKKIVYSSPNFKCQLEKFTEL